MRRLREQIEASVDAVKAHREKMSDKTAEDHAAGGFDCCDSSEVVLANSIIAAIEYLGC